MPYEPMNRSEFRNQREVVFRNLLLKSNCKTCEVNYDIDEVVEHLQTTKTLDPLKRGGLIAEVLFYDSVCKNPSFKQIDVGFDIITHVDFTLTTVTDQSKRVDVTTNMLYKKWGLIECERLPADEDLSFAELRFQANSFPHRKSRFDILMNETGESMREQVTFVYLSAREVSLEQWFDNVVFEQKALNGHEIVDLIGRQMVPFLERKFPQEMEDGIITRKSIKDFFDRLGMPLVQWVRDEKYRRCVSMSDVMEHMDEVAQKFYPSTEVNASLREILMCKEHRQRMVEHFSKDFNDDYIGAF